MVRRTKNGYKVFSEEGKALSKKCYKSKVLAEKEDKKIQFYRKRNSKK